MDKKDIEEQISKLEETIRSLKQELSLQEIIERLDCSELHNNILRDVRLIRALVFHQLVLCEKNRSIYNLY